MVIIFKSKIVKYNKKGVCFIYFPDKIQTQFKMGQQVKITIQLPNNKLIVLAKVRKHNKVGVYIPSEISEKNNLAGIECYIEIEIVNGFFTIILEDGRIYIPKHIATELNLKKDEIIKIEAIIEKQKIERNCRIRVREKKNTDEFYCFLNIKLPSKEGIFNIKQIVSRKNSYVPIHLKSLIQDFNSATVNENQIILYHGHRVSIIINTNFKFEQIAHYLGCYFSDGTKRGNSWGICASTFEQANYFIKMHNLLIHDSLLKVELTYTDPLNEEKNQLRDKLQTVWLKETNLFIPKEKIWIYNTNITNAQNRNKYGALSIKEHKQLVLIYYNLLMHSIIKQIVENKNKKLALDFICGVLEGDGSPSAKSRGHIVIATNNAELEILKQIFNVLNFMHIGYLERDNRCYIRISSLEIIENILEFKNKLFIYYEKRRNKTIERLLATSTAKFILGEQDTTSAWILKRFRRKNILNRQNKLTNRGEKIKGSLQILKKEIS